MEYSIRITHPQKGQRTEGHLIKIDELNGEATGSFVCPDPKCSVPVFPIFPEKTKTSQSPYFRASAKRGHVDNCLKDGALRYKTQDGGLTCVPVQRPRKSCREFPVRFIRARVDATEGEKGTVGNQGNHLESEGRQRQYSRAEDYQKSKRGSALIRNFAESFENSPLPLKNMGIEIPGCPAKTYAETFLDPSFGVQYLGQRIIHIYRGCYSHHVLYGSGISVYFNGQINDKPLSVWIASALGPQQVRAELLRLLDRAAAGYSAMVYVLGNFIVTHGKYAIEILSINDVWVTLWEKDFS
ncbi:hypothetical protein [Nitrospira sp. Nam74]